MFDPDIDITDTQEYRDGIDWAVMHAPELVERYSSNNLTADELRTYLWKVAGGIYPSKRDDMANELRQTNFVTGAIRRLVGTLPRGLEGMATVFDIALEMGQIYGAEKWKYVHFLELKKKDASWWRKKKGDASPNEIVAALSNRWWNTFAKEKKVSRTSKWEILIDTLGTREMCALATLKKVVFSGEGKYKTYDVEGDDCEFQMIAKPVWEDGRVHYWAGDIIG